jgi:hypothetical protein
VTAPTARELDAYRERIDRFIAALDEEYYEHFAGLKDELELEPVYREYEDVTTLEQAQRMHGGVDGSFGSRELWRFACEGYLGALTRRHEEQAAAVEASLTAGVDGEEIPFRMLRPAMANSADRDRRERIDRVRTELTEEHLNPILLESHREVHGATRDLGAATYRELYDRHEAVVEAAQVLDAGRGDLPPDLEALVRGAPERLLAEHVLAGLRGGDRRLGVHRVRRAVVEEPDALVGDEVAPVGRPALVAVPPGGLGDGRAVAARDRDEPWHERRRRGQVGERAEGVRMRLAHERVAEHADPDLRRPAARRTLRRRAGPCAHASPPRDRTPTRRLNRASVRKTR